MRRSTMVFIPAALLILAGLLSQLGLLGSLDLGGAPTMIGLVLAFVALTMAQREGRA